MPQHLQIILGISLRRIPKLRHHILNPVHSPSSLDKPHNRLLHRSGQPWRLYRIWNFGDRSYDRCYRCCQLWRLNRLATLGPTARFTSFRSGPPS